MYNGSAHLQCLLVLNKVNCVGLACYTIGVKVKWNLPSDLDICVCAQVLYNYTHTTYRVSRYYTISECVYMYNVILFILWSLVTSWWCHIVVYCIMVLSHIVVANLMMAETDFMQANITKLPVYYLYLSATKQQSFCSDKILQGLNILDGF